eukprot:TRINITY_DN23406_c0_g1_i2.p1 TRINITY_DN23406_c0_g1~~TRINITY_DN23406_c0_g1_i2.p1  ORF type:complete len:237 (+),score=52.41 TRINITY_DN23406_c0_g1_i2:352-1062(+)
MLSRGDEYGGGEFEVLRGSFEQLPKPRRGDVTLWRSWDLHRVRPLEKGHRHVFVLELWPYSDNGPDSLSGRPPGPDADTGPRCGRLLAADGASPMLLAVCAHHRLSVGHHSEALPLFRAAAELAPNWLHLWEGIALSERALLAEELEAGGERRAAAAAEGADSALGRTLAALRQAFNLRQRMAGDAPVVYDAYDSGDTAWAGLPPAAQTLAGLKELLRRHGISGPAGDLLLRRSPP